VSYFARLRQQSGLTVLETDAARVPHGRADGADVAAALDVIEMVEAPPRAEADLASSRLASLERPMQDQPVPVSTQPLASAPPLTPPDRASRQDRSGIVTRPPAAAPRDAEARLAPPQDEESMPSRDVTLRHVFQWLARAPSNESAPAIDATVETVPTRKRRADVPPARAIAAAPAPEPVSESPRQAPPVPAAPAASTPIGPVDVEVLEPERVRPPRRSDVTTPSAPARAADPQVEETLTVSIGAINVRVEGPPPSPVTVSRTPATPSPRVREQQRPASRLSRHYLHP
jgi:hypothetical protein